MLRLPAFSTRSRVPGQAGQAAVEFALVMPFVLVVTFFLIEGVGLLSTFAAMTHASREGARVGAVRKSEAEIISWTVDRSAGAVKAEHVTVLGEQGEPGTTVQVRIERGYTPNALNALMTAFLGSGVTPITLRAQTSMRLEE